MTFNSVHNSNAYTLLRAISGSKAFGLDTSTSDTDIKGVYYIPEREFYGLEYTPQVSNASNDITYYELKRFIELLEKNNPNIIELLNTPDDCILYRHPVMDMVKQELFLSKLCLDSFSGYALSQIKKAKGLNKKIFNPVEKERKSVEDFCFIIQSHQSIPLKKWLSEKRFFQEDCGLVKIAHIKDVYAIFHISQSKELKVNGIVSSKNSNDVSLSSIPLGIEPVSILSFNKDAYSIYCKQYREYWEWVAERNEHRYKKTLEHGKNYDSKNMMHTFRLLKMSYEIATQKKVIIKRHDRDFLFKIKNGDYEYDELIKMAEELMKKTKAAYSNSDLPDTPDKQKINTLLYDMRTNLYKRKH